MMGKTHIAVGIGAAYAITQPKTLPEFVIATVGGSIGGVMADIDVKIDTSNKFAAKGSLDQNIEVEYLDGSWKMHRQKFSGWTAQIVLHEMDHLEGVII